MLLKIQSFSDKLSLLVLLFFVCLTPVKSFWNGYESREFTVSKSAIFDEETRYWSSSSLNSPRTKWYNCSGALILGGYNVLGPGVQTNVFFRRTYSDLPDHNMIYMSFTLYELDSLDANEWVTIQFDATNTFQTWAHTSSQRGGTKLCGLPNVSDLPIRVFIQAAHSGPTLTLTLIPRCDQDSNDESFGFKDLWLLFANSPNPVTNRLCGISPLQATNPLPTGFACTCPEGQFEIFTTGVCQNCHEFCSSCFGPAAHQCYQCKPGYNFDGEQCVKCDDSCATCRGSNPNECSTCPTGKILFNNGQCVDASVCAVPLQLQSDIYNNKYCKFTCSSDEYMIWNRTCITSCEFPLRSVKNETGRFCLLPCESVKEYYNEETTACSRECKTWPLVRRGLYNVCLSAPNTFSRVFHYSRYLEIQLPPRLENTTVMRGNNILSLRVIPSMLRSVKEAFYSNILSPPFNKYMLSSSFLANFSDDLILLAILLVAGLLSLILEQICNLMFWSFPKFIFERLRILLLFNLLIIQLAINAGDIIFFAILEFRTYNSEIPKAEISLGFAIMMLIAVVLLIVGGFVFVFQRFKETRTITSDLFRDDKEESTGWESLQVLFKGYKESNFFVFAFFPIYCLRMTLPMIFAAAFFRISLLQAILDVIISIIMLLYLTIGKPIRRSIDQANIIVFEMLTFVFNISLLILTGLDMSNNKTHFLIVFFGEVILACNTAVDWLAILFLVLKLARTMSFALDLSRQRIPQSRALWLQLLFIPLQQGAMGFEFVQMERFSEVNIEVLERKLSPEFLRRNKKLSKKVFPIHRANNHQIQGRHNEFQDETINDTQRSMIAHFPKDGKIRPQAGSSPKSMNINDQTTLPMGTGYEDSFPIGRITQRKKRQKKPSEWKDANQRSAQAREIREMVLKSLEKGLDRQVNADDLNFID